MDEPLTLAATQRELDELAARRAQATGHPVAVVGFTAATHAHLVDLDADGEVADAWRVRRLPDPEDRPRTRRSPRKAD